MSKKRIDNEHLLWDFVYWVQFRRPHNDSTPVDEKMLEYVAQGVQLFLDGKNPWPKPRGNKSKPHITWECYWLTNFAERDKAHLPQHHEEGGAYWIVGERLNLSPKTVESHVRKARKQLETLEGRAEFMRWLSDYRYKGGHVLLLSADHPLAVAERKRRDASGVGNRYTKTERKRLKLISEQIKSK